jgi:transposase-like protein
MSTDRQDELWRNFPRTALEFEERFPSEEACCTYWIEARWNGRVACQRCNGEKVWPLRGGRLYECAQCGHQTSLTAGSLLAGTRKPFKAWFRAIFEISVHRHGISAKDLQRIMGFGSYETAWTWLHKLRRALVRPGREPLAAAVQLDEGLVGGKGSEKSMVLVGAEPGGRVRMAHAENNDEATLKRFADAQVAEAAKVTTDGLASYNARSLDGRPHDKVVQTKEQKQEKDAVQNCHWAISNLKRWLLGTHHGAVSAKHLQAYLDEFAFRYNRRKTNGVGRIASRLLQNLIAAEPMSMRQLVEETLPCRLFLLEKAPAT